nr:TIGR00282 family metallophosphoesterase [Mycoplasmopsis pullorum]
MSTIKTENLTILFIGDVFGDPGIKIVQKYLPKIKENNKIHFVIAQAENVSGRKGFVPKDYEILMSAGVDAFTLGNHVWAQKEILNIINNDNVIRPLNISNSYAGHGTYVFDVKGIKLRVTSLMGIAFNRLNEPWNEDYANNFFDCFDNLISESIKTDYHFIDFHGETTSEKSVFSLYADGKVDAICGTHTHVQTNDARILPNGTLYVTDAGMTGPTNSAIGANFQEVYEKMRFDGKSKFTVSPNLCQFNGVILELSKNKKERKIKLINFLDTNEN